MRNTTAAPRVPVWARLALLAILIFDLWLRGHTIGPTVRDRLGFAPWPVVTGEAEPLDCDEAAYAYIGRRIVAGDVMYRDLSENKPPGGYWLYTLAVALGGATETTIRLMPIPLVLATIALVWWIGLRLAGPAAGVFAALAYALGSTDPHLYANGAHLEHAINLFSVLSLALMIRAWPARNRMLLIGAGAAVGAAALVRQVAALNLVVYTLALVLRTQPRRSLTNTPGIDAGVDPPPRARTSRFGDIAALVTGFAVVWGMAALILIYRGASPDAFTDIIRYGGALATALPPPLDQPPFLIRWFTGNRDPGVPWWGTGTWPLWLASLPALGWLLVCPLTNARRRLLACWTLSAWVQVAAPRLFWNHYDLLPLPGVVLAVAVIGADAFAPVPKNRAKRAIGWAWCTLALAALVGTGALQVRDYLLVPAEDLTARFKGGRQWIELRALGRELSWRAHAWKTHPHLFIWGWQSPLFIYANLDGVSRHFFVDPLLQAKARTDPDHPLIRPRLDRIMRDLHAHPPELILTAYEPFPALDSFLHEHYLPSRLAAGLWVERSAYGRFETFPSAHSRLVPP